MRRGPGGADTETGGAMSQWSVTEIHLPQTLNEEAHSDEFSDWEQVSSGAAERFAHTPGCLPAAPFLFRPHIIPASPSFHFIPCTGIQKELY